MTQLRELATPFPDRLVHPAPQGKYGDYVSHSTVNERALSIVGPHSFEVVEVIRDTTGNVAGVLARLTVKIDGREVTVVEAGDEEHPDKKKPGEALKNAASDAYKRCWMRLGLGLHLWSQEDYFLDRQLDKNAEEEAEALREIVEQQDGGGNVVGRFYADTGEPVPMDGQEKLYDEDDPERPF